LTRLIDWSVTGRAASHSQTRVLKGSVVQQMEEENDEASRVELTKPGSVENIAVAGGGVDCML